METSGSEMNHLHSSLQNQTQQTSEAHAIFLQIVAHTGHCKHNRGKVCIRANSYAEKNSCAPFMFSHLSERRCTKANFAPEKQKILLLFAEAACFQRECFLVSKPREQLWRTMFPRDVLKLTIGLGLRILTCQGCGSIKFLGLCFRSFLLFLKPIKI